MPTTNEAEPQTAEAAEVAEVAEAAEGAEGAEAAEAAEVVKDTEAAQAAEDAHVVKDTEVAPIDPIKYRRLLETVRGSLLKSGCGQTLAFLQSRTSAEGKKLYAEIDALLQKRLSIEEPVLVLLPKRDSAFHREAALGIREVVSELRNAANE